MKVKDNGSAAVISGVGAKPPVVSAHVGPAGLTGLMGSTATAAGYTHTQTSPSASWVITHGLNRYPSVSIIVDGEEVLADVTYVSLNVVNVEFDVARSGLAILP